MSVVDFCLLMDVFMTEARGLMSAWHFPYLRMRALYSGLFLLPGTKSVTSLSTASHLKKGNQ